MRLSAIHGRWTAALIRLAAPGLCAGKRTREHTLNNVFAADNGCPILALLGGHHDVLRLPENGLARGRLDGESDPDAGQLHLAHGIGIAVQITNVEVSDLFTKQAREAIKISRRGWTSRAWPEP